VLRLKAYSVEGRNTLNHQYVSLLVENNLRKSCDKRENKDNANC